MKEICRVAKRRRDAVDALFSGEGAMEEILAERGLDAGTFFGWLDDPAFAAYFHKQTRARTDAAVLTAWKALLRGVERGECNAIKLFFELKGKEPAGEAGFDIRFDPSAREAAD